MKIAYIYDAVYPWIKGGAEKRIYEIGKRLADRGHEVHWYGIGWWFEGNNSRTIDHDGIILHGVCEPMQLYVDGRRSIKEAIYFAGKLLPKLVKERFDVIDCQEFPYFPCFTAKVHSLFRRTPLVITWHEIWDKYWFEYLGKKGLFGWLVERLTSKLTDTNIVVSEATKRDLLSLGVEEDKVHVIPNGITLKEFLDVDAYNEEFDVVFVGRLIKERNIDLLLQSISILKSEMPKIKAAIIGDGPEFSKLKELASKLNIKDNVRFFGFIEDFKEVVSIMKSSKVFVHPSTREGGSSIVSLEANACGLPVIAIKHELGISPELIKHGFNGFFIKLSPTEMANTIRVILEDSELRNQMKKNSIEFSRDFDWDVIARKIEKLYKGVAESI